MSILLPDVRVGEPIRCAGVSVFPLFIEGGGQVEYRLAEEALADQSITVAEVSEGGSVPHLLVDNRGDKRVLFLEGEELIGAKQNRILNTTVLIAAGTKTEIPVSCVERGRWRYRSRHFSSSGSHSPLKLRRTLKSSVTRSVSQQHGHTSDQGAVWDEVASLHAFHNVASGTDAMADAFETHRQQIDSFQEKLQYVDGATGLAIAIGPKVVSIDLFDKPSTCRKVWSRLLSGVVFDALEAGPVAEVASAAEVQKALAAVRDMPWKQSPPAGEGAEYRAQSAIGDNASVLLLEGALVHGNLVTAP